jgi:hypothetical protein
MRRILFLVLVTISTFTSFAQKKLVPVSESVLTGIKLPEGSLQDKRLLSVSAAKMLMEMESKKTGRSVSTIEVFVLPPATTSGFDDNMLVNELSEKGWQFSVVEDDNNYAWVQMGSRSVIMYFSMSARETSLFFALDASSPQNSGENNAKEIQTTNTVSNPVQQPVNSSTTYQAAEFLNQKETFDLITYSPPKNWEKEVHGNLISYSFVNNADKSWCRIGIVRSTISQGSITEDLGREWAELVAKPYNITDPPHLSEVSEGDGWQTQTGSGQFIFNNNKAAVIFTTFRGSGRFVSIISTTGNQRYLDDIERFIHFIELNAPKENQVVKEETIKVPLQQNSVNGFAFTTTNFDDGWVATEQPDWVQVSKENTVVLIHYAQPNIRDFNNLDEKTAFVWNTLVAPRYSNIANLWIRKSWYADGDFMNGKYFAEADLTENSSGRKVHVVLYKSGSAGKWLEFITPDKPTFQNQFAVVYQQDGTNWDKLSVMGNYNKFAVSASDLPGKWTNDFSAAIQYVNVYTGFDAGMDTNSSKENFLIGSDSRYNWDLGVANGQVGNIKYQSVKSTGKFSMNSIWQITFSDIEGKPHTYNAYFSCIKGLRILWLDDKSFAKIQ